VSTGKTFLTLLLSAIICLAAPFALQAQDSGQGQAGSSAAGAPGPVAPTVPAQEPGGGLFPDRVAGLKAAGEIRRFSFDNLNDLVGDKAALYREYLVAAAASRDYAGARLDVFQTQNKFAALGLFLFTTAPAGARAATLSIGDGAAALPAGVVFWKGRYFVRVANPSGQPEPSKVALYTALARNVAASIAPDPWSATAPPLLESLPAQGLASASRRYFLGPESLNTCVDHGRDMFGFAGDAEAVMGEYQEPQAAGAAAASSPAGSSAMAAPAVKLVIVEYHTPQFAYDAMGRVASYIESLPEAEQNRIIVKREGNYIVEASGVAKREFAEALVNSVQYPYTVKWLRDPLLPTNDPFRVQKAAQMLVSTFGLLGLILGSVLVGGAAFGATIFLKRRKRQREAFSDAGGMLRLDIDPVETAMLGLPPAQE